MTAPLTPADADLRDFPRMALDVQRLMGSEFNALASRAPIAWMVGHKLWYRAWHQVPAGSLPDDDEQLCHLAELGFDLKTFRKARTVALRGWARCDDGRLYHPVVAETVLEAWIEKLLARLSSQAGHAKRYGHTFDPASINASIELTASALEHLNPRSKALDKLRRRQSRQELPAGSEDSAGTATGSALGLPPAAPPALPPAWQEKEKGKEKGNSTLPERAQTAAPTDPGKEGWDRGVALLTGRGRMKPTLARALFGKLLSNHGLEARDLLASVVAAEGAGTQDPQAYLTRAAAAVAQRRGRPTSTGPTGWGDPEWTVALRMLEERGAWPETNGPRPGEPGCLVPAPLLVRGVG